MKMIVIALLLLSAGIAGAAPNASPSMTAVSVISIYDGDTFTVNIGDCLPVVCARMPVRIAGIDAPEIRGKCEREKALARQAKQFLINQLRSGKAIELLRIDRDKYFRLNAEVFVGGVNVGALLIGEGLARHYDGGKRAGWC